MNTQNSCHVVFKREHWSRMMKFVQFWSKATRLSGAEKKAAAVMEVSGREDTKGKKQLLDNSAEINLI